MAKYLYKGLELPALPEWDKTAYPYAYIYYVGETPTFCTLVLIPAAAEIVYEEGTSAILFATTHYRSYYARSVDEQWDDNGITETSGSIYLLKPWLDYPDNYTVLQWTNFNVYNKDNELMFPESDPVPVEEPTPDDENFDLKSWLTGFALGLASKPLQLNEGNPVAPEARMAHVYNGIPLPPISWDTVTYPYALILYLRDGGKFLYCVYKRINYFEFGFLRTPYFGDEADGTCLVFEYTPGEAGWIQLEDTSYYLPVKRNFSYNRVVWANFPLMYSDETLYMGASKPEPITDVAPWEDMYFHSFLACTKPFNGSYDSHYKEFIVKIGNRHVAFLVFNYLGGGSFGIYNKALYLYPCGDYTTVYWLDSDSREWKRGETEDYLGEETYEYNGNTYYYVCDTDNIVWVEENLFQLGYSTVNIDGYEPVPVDLTVLEPPSDPEPPSSVGTDNESMLLTKGWLVGRAIASQRKKQENEQWETLLEATLTTEENTTVNGAVKMAGFGSYGGSQFYVGDTIRLTVDGVSTVFTAVGDGTSNDGGRASVGNGWLSTGGTTSKEDTGYDYRFSNYTGSIKVFWFYSREVGTYAVKVERLQSDE